MAAQKGRSVLIKVDTNGSGSFETIGGMRSKSLTINKETVDVSDSDSAGQWRELLGGAGVKSMTLSGSGVFKDSTTEGKLREYMMGDALIEFQFIMPGLGTFEGPFDLTTLEYSGEYNGEAQYSVTVESGGEITFTAA